MNRASRSTRTADAGVLRVLAESGQALRREGLVDGSDAVFAARGRVRVEVAAGGAEADPRRQRERRVEVARKVVVSVAGPIRLGRIVPLAEVVDLRRVFVPRIPPQERAIGSEPLEVDVGVEHVGAAHRAARRAANPELLAEQVRSAVAEAAAHALSGPHAAQARAGCRLRPLPESRPSPSPRSTRPLAMSTIAFWRSGQSSATLSARSAAMASSRVCGTAPVYRYWRPPRPLWRQSGRA